MSREPPAGRVERRRDRAERDLRGAHSIASRILDTWSGEGWNVPGSRGQTPAEISLHLALVAEGAYRGLAIGAAHGAMARSGGPSLGQRASQALLAWAWRLPAGACDLSGSDASGINLAPEAVRNRHTRWAADLLEFVRAHPPRFLENVRCSHPVLGELDTYEWARFLVAHARHHDLALSARKGGGP